MFDIDKIFLSMKAYQKIDGKLTDKHDEGTAEFHQNRLLDDYIALLCDFIEDEKGNKTTRSMHMLHASIDNDTSLIEDVIDDLQESGHKNALQSYDAYTLRHMCRAKDDFITGKTGIGPYALNNNSQVLTTLYEVEFEVDKNSIMTRLGLNSLHNQFDKDGESIMSWLSGLINIHVDVAKDPKHNKLNINGYTHNLVNLLIRTGFGKNTFYFTTQPIMKELATIINNASGKYMLEKGVSQSKLKKNAEQAFIMNIARANDIKGKTFGAVMQNWEQSMHDRQIGINATIDWLLLEGADVMRQIAKSGEGIDSKTTYKVQTLWDGKPHTEILSMFDIQMLMYRAFKQFTPYAEALSNLVKYSKIDTKKHGKNLLEQKKYMQGYHAMFDDNSQDKSRMLFKVDGLQRLRDKTYIGRMTENAIGVFSDIMGTQVIQGTDKFIDRDGCMDAVLSAIGRYGSTDDQLLKSVSGAILAKKKSEFFNKWAQDNEIDIKGLVDGNDTIFNRLCKLKSELICVDKYRGMLDANGNIKNYMLRTLVAGYTHDFSVPASAPYGTMIDDYKSVKFITTLNFLDDESIDQDEFTQSWEDLLNDTRYPELQKFARDLIMYAFITAGDNGGRNDIMKFIPNSWKIESGYVDHMVNVLDKFNDNKFTVDSTLSVEEIEDIILNNWYDDNYIHTVNVKNVREFFSKVKQPDGKVRKTEYATIIGLSDNSSIESEFIKIPRPNIGDPESQRRYVLYKRIGFGKREQQFERMINGKPTIVTDVSTYPIYVAVEPRGNRFVDRSLILSYGRNESSRESLTNMCLDALAFKLLVDRGVKVQNTEQAFAELSAIFHETDPAITKYMKDLYDSSIQDVIEEYNSYKYAAFIDDASVSAPGAVPFPSVNYYTGMIVPDDNTIFVFGSNPEGRHGAGAAKTAVQKFGAIYGQGEGLQGNAYALPTKDLRVTNTSNLVPGIRALVKFGRMHEIDSSVLENIRELDRQRSDYNSLVKRSPIYIKLQNMLRNILGVADEALPENTSEGLQKLYQELKRDQQKAVNANLQLSSEDTVTEDAAKIYHDYHERTTEFIVKFIKEFYGIDAPVVKSEWYAGERTTNPNLVDNQLRSISPKQIIESIKKMYDVARQNPDKQFKVAYTNDMDETTLNGYTGREMMQMFKDAGPIPQNVLFSEVWARHWDDFTLPETKDEAERRGENVFQVPEGIDKEKGGKGDLQNLGAALMDKCGWNK